MGRNSLVSWIVAVAIAAASVWSGLAQERSQRGATQRVALEEFLRDYVKDPDYDYKATRYFAAFVNLRDGKSQQVIVYFTDRYSCGSGGCTTLILEPSGTSFRVVTALTVVRLPIRVLNTRSNGWHDISVWVQGGGIQPGYQAKLSFDGETYPRNPSTPPAQPLQAKVAGKVAVPSGVEGTPLFP